MNSTWLDVIEMNNTNQTENYFIPPTIQTIASNIRQMYPSSCWQRTHSFIGWLLTFLHKALILTHRTTVSVLKFTTAFGRSIYRRDEKERISSNEQNNEKDVPNIIKNVGFGSFSKFHSISDLFSLHFQTNLLTYFAFEIELVN